MRPKALGVHLHARLRVCVWVIDKLLANVGVVQLTPREIAGFNARILLYLRNQRLMNSFRILTKKRKIVNGNYPRVRFRMS